MNFIDKNIKNDKIIFNSVNDKFEIEIDGPIGKSLFSDGYTFDKFKDDLTKIEANEVVINISSFGGDLFEALNIYDSIKSLDKKVTTKIIGSSASAATVISLAGDERLISKNSRYLIHKPMVGVQGNSDDFEKALDQLKDLDKQLVGIYVENSNLNSEEVLNLMKEEKFISAKEAIEYGFISDYIKTKNKNMDKEILNIAGVENEMQLKEKISNFVNESEDKDKEIEDLKAKLAEKEKPENPAKPGQTDEEYIQELEEANAVLKERVAELEEKLKELEVDEAEAKATEIGNFLKESVDNGLIKDESKDEWFNLANEQGLAIAKTLLNSVNKKVETEKTKLSTIIEDKNEGLTKEDVIKKWKSGEISADEYLNMIK